MCKSVLKTSLVLSITSLVHLINASPSFANDLSFYGGRVLDASTTSNTLSASLGIDIPSFLGAISPNQIRTDFGYGFENLDLSFPSLTPGETIDTDLGFNRFEAYTGPGWRFELLDRFAVYGAAQAGLAVTTVDQTITNGAIPDFDLADFSELDFAYQFPVGVEYGFSKRVGIAARYRAVGTLADGGNFISHVIEGGVVFRF